MAARYYTLGSSSVAARARRELHQAHHGRCRAWRPCTALAYTPKDNIHDWRVRDTFEKAEQYFRIWSLVRPGEVAVVLNSETITQSRLPASPRTAVPACIQMCRPCWVGAVLHWRYEQSSCQCVVQGDVSKADTLLADDFVHNDVVWGRQQLVAGPKVRAHRATGQHLVLRCFQPLEPTRLLVTVSSEGTVAPAC